MKKMILTLIAVMVASMYTASMASVEISKGDVRTETRFLTDKMRYELNLDDQQYNDVYEINYDFFYSVRNIMDNVAYGDEYALKTYYDELNIRNDDLRYVLGSDQYEEFINKDYFSRPFYLNNNSWGLEVYFDYGPDVYYYPYPTVYASYYGGHARTSIRVNSYYINRYDHPIFTSVVRYRNNSAIRYMDIPVNTPRYNADNRNNYNRSYNNTNSRSYNRSGNTRSYSNPSNGSSNSSTRSFTNPYNGSIRSYSNPSNGTSTPSTRSYSNPNNGSSNSNSTRTYSNPSNGTSTPPTRNYSNPNNGSSNNNSTRTFSNPSNGTSTPPARSYSNPNNGSSNNNSTRTFSNPSNGTSTPPARSYSNPNNGSSNNNSTRTYSNPNNGGSTSPTRIYSRPTVQPAKSQPAATNNNVKPNTRSYGGGSETRK